MKLHTIDTGLFKLDGGAMHGVVPKSIWNKFNPADDNNLCTWAMRSLLIESGKRLILIDTGCGTKQDAKFFSYYFLHGDGELHSSLNKLGFSADDITDVVLTHMHFDHVGGATSWNSDKSKAIPTFKNATYWSTEAHWDWAINPNPREKASFLKENFMPIKESGQLIFIKNDSDFGLQDMTFNTVNGHTEAMLIPIINYKDRKVAFMADLIPSVGHLPLAYVQSYDVRPLESMKEKEAFLKHAIEKNYVLFYEHDAKNECSTLINTEKGVRQGDIFKLNEW